MLWPKKKIASTHLAFDRPSFFVITIRGCAERSSWGGSLCPITSRDSSSLRKVLFSLGLADLDLLLLAATAQLVRLELPLGLELSAAMLGDEALGHLDSMRPVLRS